MPRQLLDIVWVLLQLRHQFTYELGRHPVLLGDIRLRDPLELDLLDDVYGVGEVHFWPVLHLLST